VADVEPDGVSWAKGIANGFPLGAFWATDRVRDPRGPLCDLLGPGSHGTTYGGNPVSCVAALKVLEVITRDGLLDAAVERGEQLSEALLRACLPGVAEVRSLGLMIGVELGGDFPPGEKPAALRAVLECMTERLLVIPAGENVVRFLPPLNVDAGEIMEAVEKFGNALRRLAAAPAVMELAKA